MEFMSWSELLVILIVAIIFIGPKELPMVMYNLARGIGKLRRNAEEFRQQFLDQMRQAGYEDVQKEMQALRGLNPANQIRDNVEEMIRKAASITEPLKTAVETPPALSVAAAAPEAAMAPVVAASPSEAPAGDSEPQPANENKRPAAL